MRERQRTRLAGFGYLTFLLMPTIPIILSPFYFKENGVSITTANRVYEDQGYRLGSALGPAGVTLNRLPRSLDQALDGIDMDSDEAYKGQWEVGDPQKLAMVFSAGEIEFDFLMLRGTLEEGFESQSLTIQGFRKS